MVGCKAEPWTEQETGAGPECVVAWIGAAAPLASHPTGGPSQATGLEEYSHCGNEGPNTSLSEAHGTSSASLDTEEDGASVEDDCDLSGNDSYAAIANAVEISPAVITNRDGKQLFLCHLCPYTSNRKCNVIVHTRTHRSPPSGGSARYATVHNSTADVSPAFTSNGCGKQVFYCHLCPYSSNKKCNVIVHIRTHASKRRFSCNVCPSTFKEKNNLVRHSRLHTGERPFRCDICQSSFIYKAHLIRHHRVHTRERPFQCDVCACCFSQKDVLVRHMRMHTGEKPYACTACPKAFTQRCNLLRHMERTHS